MKIYHSGVELGRNAAKADDEEYFTYDYSTGKLTLYLKHASFIDVVYDKPGATTVTTRAQLEAAFADRSISTIKLGRDIPVTDPTSS